VLFRSIGREQEGHQKLLWLHEHHEHRYLYTERENACLDFAVRVCRDPHEVTDAEFAHLKVVLERYNRGLAGSHEMSPFDVQFVKKWASYTDAQHKALVDSQIVELSWLISHFCLLNRWFTVLQVPDETASDEANFLGAYIENVPEDIRRRNDQLLKGGF